MLVKSSTTIGRYRVERELGRGASGSVWLGKDRFHAELTVLKLAALGDRQRVEGLRREAQILADLAHPCLPHVRSFFTDTSCGVQGLALDYFPGRTLDEAAQGASLPVLAELLWKTLHIVGFLHARGLVHGDPKPENILVEASGGGDLSVRVIDLGFSIRAGSGAAGVMRGTPRYAAPSVLDGCPATTSTDLYAIGATFLEVAASACAGQEPAARCLAAVLARLAAPDEDARYRSCEAAAAELARGVGLSEEWLLPEPAYVRRAADRVLDAFISEHAAGKRRPALTWVRAARGGGATRTLGELAMRAELAGLTVVRAAVRASMRAQLEAELRALEPQTAALICVDDGWRLEADELDWLRGEAARPDSRIWVCVASPTEPSCAGARVLDVPLLGDEDARQLVRSMLPPGSESEELAQRVAVRSGGRARFAVEAARAAARLGGRPMRCELDSVVLAALPSELREVLRERLAALSEGALGLLRRLTALPPIAPRGCVQDLCADLSGWQVALAELESAGLARVDSAAEELHCDDFALRGIVQAELEGCERLALARRAAEAWVRQATSERGPDGAASAADLWLAAGARAEAIEWSCRAIEDLLAGSLGAQASKLAVELLAIGLDPATDFRALELIGDAFALAGRAAEACTVFASLATSGGLRVARKHGAALAEIGRFEAAEQLLAAALAAGADPPPEVGELALAYEVLAQSSARQGRIARAVEWLHEGLGVLPSPDDHAAAMLWNDLGVITSFSDVAAAYEPHERALRIREAHGDREGASRSYNNLGNLALAAGRPDEAREHCERALELRRTVGVLGAIATTLTNLGAIARWQGRYRDALDRHEEALELRRGKTGLENEATSRRELAEVWLDKGQLRAARRESREAVRLATAVGKRTAGFAESLYVQAAVELSCGELQAAVASASRGLSIATECGSGVLRALLGALLCEAQLLARAPQEGEGEELLDQLESYVELASTLDRPHAEAVCLLRLARCSVEAARVDVAARSAERAADHALRLGFPLLGAESDLLLGRLAVRSGRASEASERLHRAEDVARSLGLIEIEWAVQAALAEFHRDHGRPERALLWLQRCTRSLRGALASLDDATLEDAYLSHPRRRRVLEILAPSIAGV